LPRHMKPGPIPSPCRDTISGFFLSRETFDETKTQYGRSTSVSAK